MLETKFFSILFYLMHPLEVYYYNNLINSVIFIIYLQFLYSAYYNAVHPYIYFIFIEIKIYRASFNNDK